jgi:hypothetical protein
MRRDRGGCGHEQYDNQVAGGWVRAGSQPVLGALMDLLDGVSAGARKRPRSTAFWNVC